MVRFDSETAESGLEALFTRHRADLLRFLTARCGSSETAEDFLQDLWIKVSMASTGPVANGRAYLYRMANSLVLDEVRSRHRAMRRDRTWLEEESAGLPDPEARPDPAEPADEAIARGQEAALLERAIAALPEGAQRALRLYRLEERSQMEIARIMGISRSGVEKHLAVAMKHLRDSLADCGWIGSAALHEQEEPRGGEPRQEHKP